MKTIETTSRITCPCCYYVSAVIMPADTCTFFYHCPECKTRLRPTPGDCCVFCSYGSIPCPPVQQDNRRSQTDRP